MGFAASVKVRLARAMCSPIVGKAARTVLRGRIPNRGCTFHARDAAVSDRVVASVLWGFYESAERRFVDRYLPPNLDVIELGSSLGAVSSHVARRLAPGRKLVCVEANATLLPTQRTNVQANGPRVDASFVTAAVGYGVDTLSFEIGEESIGSRVDTGAGRPTVTVPAVTLATLRDEHGIGDFALVMDIEGAEVDILFEGDLSACRYLIAELHPATRAGTRYTVDELLAVLIERHGMHLVDRHGPVVVLDRP